MKLCTILSVPTLIFACELCMADSGRANVCVVSFDRFLASTVKQLSIALSKEKLQSGRLIVAVPLDGKPKSDIPREVQSAGCDYVVRLQSAYPEWPLGNDTPIVGVGPGAAGRDTSPEALPVHEGLNLPSLNYGIEEVGTNKVLASGNQIAEGRPFRTDYSALSRKIARQISSSRPSRTP